MENEYGVETRVEMLPFSVARWVAGGCGELWKSVGRLFNTVTVKDSWGRPVLLFKNEWNCQQVQSDHPELKLNATARVVAGKRTRVFVIM